MEEITKLLVENENLIYSVASKFTKYKDILLWCKANRATCKIIPMFATNYQYEVVEIPDLKIKINPKIQISAF